MRIEMNIKVKTRMNSQEIKEWKNGKLFTSLKGYHPSERWKLNINFDYFDNISISIYGYNDILFGEFKLDNGYINDKEYYPIMRFYNKLSLSNRGGYDCGDTLCSDVDFGNEEICELNFERIFKAVDESWNKIKEFLS